MMSASPIKSETTTRLVSRISVTKKYDYAIQDSQQSLQQHIVSYSHTKLYEATYRLSRTKNPSRKSNLLRTQSTANESIVFEASRPNHAHQRRLYDTERRLLNIC